MLSEVLLLLLSASILLLLSLLELFSPLLAMVAKSSASFAASCKESYLELSGEAPPCYIRFIDIFTFSVMQSLASHSTTYIKIITMDL